MLLTISDCARFAKIAYDKAREPYDPASRWGSLAGYREFCNYNVPAGRDQVVIRGWTSGSDTVLAVKGTTPTNRGDLASDGQLAIGLRPDQYRPAVDVVAKALVVAPGRVTITGHSLGGNIAQHLTAGSNGRHRCVTFNAPGRGVSRSHAGDLPNALNIVDRWDVIRFGGGSHFGRTYKLRTMYAPAVSAHSMDRMVRNVETDPIGPLAVGTAIARFG
ncbi:MAG: hypothetical protein INR65_04430 [Gluconacetobacter diazotrophicus]|nr:hypothetical protein [Gluconacetobacter diazotrophicus]